MSKPKPTQDSASVQTPAPAAPLADPQVGGRFLRLPDGSLQPIADAPAAPAAPDTPESE